MQSEIIIKSVLKIALQKKISGRELHETLPDPVHAPIFYCERTSRTVFFDDASEANFKRKQFLKY